MAPPSVTVICAAFTVTDPAIPIEPGTVSVPILDPAPLIDNGPETATATRPEFPVLDGKFIKVRSALEIAPPLTRAREPALTLTSPAFPELPASEFATMPVAKTLGFVPDPSIVSAPSTVTTTFPPFPSANVALEITPL
jgi:hypothetical protein